MLIQITTITGELVETITIDRIPRHDVIVYLPCAYCGELIKFPRKTCSTNCRVNYWRKDINSATS